ncbi:HFCD family protein [Streptomyces avermitilis]|uniref:hypothetical protein n=1 Tax=Streptomyces avermitilis TaxID=33903 RepID=UPI0036AA266F
MTQQNVTVAVTGAGGTGAAKALLSLRNMGAVTEAGSTVYPMIPTYYNVPETLAQLRDEFVERVLQFLGLPGTDRYQWDGRDTAARREHTQAQ